MSIVQIKVRLFFPISGDLALCMEKADLIKTVKGTECAFEQKQKQGRGGRKRRRKRRGGSAGLPAELFLEMGVRGRRGERDRGRLRPRTRRWVRKGETSPCPGYRTPLGTAQA